MGTSNKQYRGIGIIRVSDQGIGRFALASVVDGHRTIHQNTTTEIKRLIDKALTSDRVSIDRGRLVFLTSDDYFAMFDGGPMPTAEQVARAKAQRAVVGIA